MVLFFKAGDYVKHMLLPFSHTGIGLVVSVSSKSGKIWVKWKHMKRISIEDNWRLLKVEEPIAILKEIL